MKRIKMHPLNACKPFSLNFTWYQCYNTWFNFFVQKAFHSQFFKTFYFFLLWIPFLVNSLLHRLFAELFEPLRCSPLHPSLDSFSWLHLTHCISCFLVPHLLFYLFLISFDDLNNSFGFTHLKFLHYRLALNSISILSMNKKRSFSIFLLFSLIKISVLRSSGFCIQIFFNYGKNYLDKYLKFTAIFWIVTSFSLDFLKTIYS